MAPDLLYSNYIRMFPSVPSHVSRRAFTMVDVLGAVAVVGLAVGGLFSANQGAISLLKASKQAAVASKCLQQRIEQIRNYNWTQVTDNTAMLDLYATPPLPSVELPGFSEQVTISQYLPPIPPTPAAAPVGPFIQITRTANGTVSQVLPDAPNLVDGMSVRVDVQISWPGPDGRSRMRETSVVLTNGGLGR